MAEDAAARTRRLRGRVFFACAAFVVVMVGAAYAAVPLYKRFCQLTGFNGAVRRADPALTAAASDGGAPLTVRFDTNVRTLPWRFEAETRSQLTHVGAPSTAYFKVTNTSTRPWTGRATYNVAPEAAGAYLVKTRCFCFDDQTIAPGQTVEFPVVYMVQPGFSTDRDTRGFSEITLSYTFFPSPGAAAPAKTAAATPQGLGATAPAPL
jgi:cytochrome c oxidase assembly protein subunit 11